METSQDKRLRKYSSIGLGAVLVMAFVLVQPTMQNVYAVGVAGGLSGYDDCDFRGVTHEGPPQPEDPISMNTVKSGNIVKTIHAEKEIFDCDLVQGDLRVIVDVTTYIELYENIADREVIASNAVSVTCIKDAPTATVIDCESKPVGSDPVPVGNNCEEVPYITHPQEMNTVNKGSIAKTIEAQKEVFVCGLGLPEGLEVGGENFEVCAASQVPIGCFSVIKKVDVILFTDIYENLATQTVEEVQFHSMRCVVLVTNDNLEEDPEDDVRDATVETCQFSTIDN